MKCSFCKNELLYVKKEERDTGQQMILYKCKDCKIGYKEFYLNKGLAEYNKTRIKNCL
jgi:transposase-like protein